MSRKRILIVEDDAPFRFALTTELRAAGYTVFSAEDGQRALDLLCRAKTAGEEMIDLVVTDIVMPHVNGLRFLEQLREKGCDLPVVVMTAFLEPSVRAAAGTLGVNGLLEKPFSVEQFMKAVHDALGEGNDAARH